MKTTVTRISLPNYGISGGASNPRQHPILDIRELPHCNRLFPSELDIIFSFFILYRILQISWNEIFTYFSDFLETNHEIMLINNINVRAFYWQ